MSSDSKKKVEALVDFDENVTLKLDLEGANYREILFEVDRLERIIEEWGKENRDDSRIIYRKAKQLSLVAAIAGATAMLEALLVLSWFGIRFF